MATQTGQSTLYILEILKDEDSIWTLSCQTHNWDLAKDIYNKHCEEQTPVKMYEKYTETTLIGHNVDDDMQYDSIED